MAWSRWIGVGIAVGVVCALVPVVSGSITLEHPLGPLSKLQARERRPAFEPSFAGLDPLRMTLRPERVTAPLDKGLTAELTLDATVQRITLAVMKSYRVPQAGVVLMDVASGNLLAYASFVNEGSPADLNVVAEAPAASVFKIVTGAALVEKAGLNPETEQCYHGGRSRILADELRDDAARDKWCGTLGMAMARSINVIFGRLAQKHLTPEDLVQMAGAFGFGSSVPFELKNEATQVEIPADPLEFARASAGFWHSTLSPIQGAVLAQTVANGGVALKPRLVRAIYDGKDKVWEQPAKPCVLRRSVKPETAAQLSKMMSQTVANGSGFKGFHDAQGRSFLPGIEVAGKTGTLTRPKDNREYSWFVGFAPIEKPAVAIAALVVNNPTWRIKGPHLARDVLRAYFAEHGARGVTNPL
ncbi:MAG TPA: penicillin-binding transpeptidase domain-containing protein [Polyangiaceae bacterium]|jgi:cell division protein FtsI/penicillin-binding protein 2